jgi:NitT/TauT family transport system permease protein
MASFSASPRRPLSARLRDALPAILFALGVLALWEGLIVAFNIQQFLLPRPSSIFNELMGEIQLWLTPGQSSLLMQATGATLYSALGGLFIGCGAGFLVALLTARWTIVNQALMPLAIAANSVPIIAFAPIMNNWFGITNPASKMAIVAIIVFFPMMINTVRGLTLVDERQLELMTSYAASPFKILWSLRLPNALPFVFSALRVASSLSVIGAIVSEFFGGPRATLGVFITQEASRFAFTRTWAAIVVASVIGLTVYNVVLWLERRIMPWHSSMRKRE